MKRNNQMGVGRLRVVIVIAIVLVVGYGLYKLVPLAWHGLQTLRHGARLWWHVNVADPVFGAILSLLVATHGQVVAVLATLALAHWTLMRINRTISGFGFQKMAKQPQTVQENLIGQMENVQGKLKRLFSDDIEKIALFGGKVGADQPERKAANPLSLGCLGCLPGLLWSLLSVPVVFMLSLAIYDGVLRLTVTPDSVDSLTAFAANRNLSLQTLLPIQNSVLLFGTITVNLADRSLILTGLLAVIGLATWYVNNISTSGWTLPRLINRYPLYGYILMMAICYLFLNSALLIFGSCWALYSLIYAVLAKFFFRPFFLRLRMALKPKATVANAGIKQLAPAN
jgi:hypothetical protein